jgi:hypothetical protein
MEVSSSRNSTNARIHSIGHYVCSNVDIQLTDRQNVDKMTEDVDKMTEDVNRMTEDVNRMIENVDFF